MVRPQSAGPEAEQLPGVPRPLCSRAGSHHSCSPGRPSPGRMSGWMSGQMDGWMNGQMEGWMNGQMEGWMNGQMDG